MDASWVARRLAEWFQEHGRDLPWRHFPDPYRILVAEFILQQTRMETGLRYFDAFLGRFPTLESLAQSDVEDVLQVWSGLGYYSRARRLHATARRIVDEHGGTVPSDVSDLQDLPGVGPYTAGAIASIAYDRPEPALDGNQIRVLGRLTGAGAAGTARSRRRLTAESRRLLTHASPRILNQALMDLGSAVCLPGIPQCGDCPLAARCPAKNTFSPNRRRAAASRGGREEAWTVTVHRRGRRIWLAEPRPTGLLAGLWLPPMRRTQTTGSIPHLVHTFSHKRWALNLDPSSHPPSGRGKWVGRRELAALPHSRLTQRIFDAVLG